MIPLTCRRVSEAVMMVYRRSDDLPRDESTMALLRTIGDHPDILARSEISEAMFDHLLDVFDVFEVETELVCRIAEEAVRRRGMEVGTGRNGFFFAIPALIDIALHLQRSGNELRSRGMDLFESHWTSALPRPSTSPGQMTCVLLPARAPGEGEVRVAGRRNRCPQGNERFARVSVRQPLFEAIVIGR